MLVRPMAIRCLLIGAFGALCSLGCSRDFDGLFTQGSDASASGGGDASADATGDDGSAGKTFIDVGSVQCPSGTACTKSCDQGTKCKIDCAATETCNLGCSGCSGTFTCASDTCAANCNTGSICDTTCTGENCSMSCSKDSQCILRCGARAVSCQLDCQGGQQSTCSNHTLTCNRACP